MNIKNLTDALKENGLELTEAAAKMVVLTTLSWVEKEASESSNLLLKMLPTVIPVVKPIIMKAVDAIDGHVG